MLTRFYRTSQTFFTLSQHIRYASVTTIKSHKLTDINSKLLQINHTKNPKQKPTKNNLSKVQFTSFTDHLLNIDWTSDYGWHSPMIIPYAPFQLDPSSSCLHYALEAFEGMKAYRDSNDRIRLFRPHKNLNRLNSACTALFFPTFNTSEFTKCLYKLLSIDREWIPSDFGHSLYVRPTIISTHAHLGMAPAQACKLYVILAPVGPLYNEPIALLASDTHVRAWPGGAGDRKLGSNYAPAFKPREDAKKQGYHAIMWLFPNAENGEDFFVSEVGTMNQFFFWKNKDGDEELITAPLDGTILPGVTRDSVLTLCKDWNRFKVTERPFTMDEVIDAIDDGRMIESFGSGTAAIVSPVNKIGFNGKDYKIPLDKNDPNANAGPLATELFNNILDIQYGKKEYKGWSVIVPEK
eukprot:449758_1